MNVIIQRLVSLLYGLSGTIIAKMIAGLQKRGVAVNTVKEVAQKVKDNPAVAAVVVSVLVDLGIEVGGLFAGVDDSDPVVKGLMRTGLARVNKVSDADAELSYDGSLEQLSELKSLVKWAGVAFGTSSEARLLEAHARMRQFVETSTDDFAKAVALFGSRT